MRSKKHFLLATRCYETDAFHRHRHNVMELTSSRMLFWYILVNVKTQLLSSGKNASSSRCCLLLATSYSDNCGSGSRTQEFLTYSILKRPILIRIPSLQGSVGISSQMLCNLYVQFVCLAGCVYVVVFVR